MNQEKLREILENICQKRADLAVEQYDSKDYRLALDEAIAQILALEAESRKKLEADVERLNRIFGGIEVENPDAINIMIDAMSEQNKMIGEVKKSYESTINELTDSAEQQKGLIIILQSKLQIAVEALKEITIGKGAYSTCQLQHASNCIEDMKQTAKSALTQIEGKV